MSPLAVWVLALAITTCAAESPAVFQWQAITDITSSTPPPGVSVTITGPPQRPFPRPAPRTLDPSMLSDFRASYNLMQDVNPTGPTTFTDVSPQYVATIANAFVEGEAGTIYDAAARVYNLPYHHHTRTNPTIPLPTRTPAQAATACTERHARLATIVQRYGHMYYHFLEEALPRVASLQAAGALGPDTKLLTWGQPYEAAWLAALGVTPDQIVAYDPEKVVCADTLIVPTPVPRITPPREALLSLRSALNIQDLPEEQRDLIVYVTRETEPTRRVSNEAELLAALRAAFPAHPVTVFRGDLSPAATIALFQRARAVVGPHGAGLSHAVFSAPGTALVEFLFMADPPMMFWHTAGALELEYWLLPVPHSFYMQREMKVPEGEVVDILTAAGLAGAPPAGACAPGTAGRPGGPCFSCPPGSYAYTAGSRACKVCTPGRVAGDSGATACRTCPAGTVSSVDGTECEPCPAVTHSVLPGASDAAAHCLTPDARRRRLQEQALSAEMLTKLSPVFANHMRRRMLADGGSFKDSAALTLSELCAARAAAGIGAGPYLSGLSGPYAFDPSICPPADGTGSGAVGVLPTPPPYGVLPPDGELPQIPVPVPPPSNGDGSLRGDPQPPPPPTTEPPGGTVGGSKKKVLDAWVIALIVTAAVLILIPILVCMGMWCAGRRRRRVTRTPTVGPPPAPSGALPGATAAGGAAGSSKKSAIAGSSSSKTPTGFAVSNPTFDLRASSTNGSSPRF